MWKRKKKVEKFKSFGWENMSRFSDSFTRTSSMCYTRCSSATSKTPSKMWAQRNTTAAATSAASCQNKRKNVLLQNFFFFSLFLSFLPTLKRWKKRKVRRHWAARSPLIQLQQNGPRRDLDIQSVAAASEAIRGQSRSPDKFITCRI